MPPEVEATHKRMADYLEERRSSSEQEAVAKVVLELSLAKQLIAELTLERDGAIDRANDIAVALEKEREEHAIARDRIDTLELELEQAIPLLVASKSFYNTLAALNGNFRLRRTNKE